MGQGSVVEVLAGTAARDWWSTASPKVREHVRCSLRDWFAVTIAGSVEPQLVSIGSLAAVAAADSPNSATSIVTQGRVGLLDAALHHGVAGHVLDFDDTNVGPLEGHPSAVMFPAVLSLAESHELSIGAVLDAYSAGVQVADQLGSRVSPEHYAAGWHATSTVGSIGAAAAGARLLALPNEGVGDAIALAATQLAGTRASFGTMAKPLQVGRGAATAVQAALVASVGVHGPLDAVDEHPAFRSLRGTNGEMALPMEFVHDLETPATAQTLLKWHASCHGTHAALEAVALLGVPADDVEWVEIGLRPDLLDVCGIETPHTPLELKFSTRGVVAMALAGLDTADPSQYSSRTLQSPEWESALRKVWVGPSALDSEWQAAVSVGAVGGRTRSVDVDLRRKLAGEEIQRRVERKFERLVVPVLGTAATDQLWALLADPDEVDVVEVMSLTGRAA